MNPNDNQYPIDYLNQIAPQQQKPMVSKKLVFLLIGGVILLVIIALLLISSSGSGPTQKMQTLAARLQTLQTVANNAQKNIKNGELRSTNSNLTIYLTNTNRDIADPLGKNGVDVKKLDKSIVEKEKGEKLTQTLEDARLNAVFDSTYAREMAFQLETVAVLMQEIYGSSKSTSLKDFLVNTDSNLQPIKKQFSEFGTTNS